MFGLDISPQSRTTNNLRKLDPHFKSRFP